MLKLHKTITTGMMMIPILAAVGLIALSVVGVVGAHDPTPYAMLDQYTYAAPTCDFHGIVCWIQGGNGSQTLLPH